MQETLWFAPPCPRGLFGAVKVPPSKSLAQRGLLAACIAGVPSTVCEFPLAEDPELLLAALGAVGYRLRREGDSVAVEGFSPVGAATLFLGNNGTGMRLLLAHLATIPGRYRLDGTPRLRERPVAPLVEALRQAGASIVGERLPVEVVGGKPLGGSVMVDASLSSQFVSALLFAGARLPQGLVVEVKGKLPSRPYVTMTCAVLRAFGARVTEGDRVFSVRGPLAPRTFPVEGDWSAAAFPMVGVAVAGGEVEVLGVQLPSAQGDSVIATLLREAGCEVTVTARGVRVRGPATKPLRADLQDCPDLFPPLSVLVALRGGRLTGLGNLAVKESPRLAVMAEHCRRLGLVVEVGSDWFAAPGGSKPATPPEPLSPAGDHRVAMALALASLVAPGLAIQDPGCVGKSWPGFFAAWEKLVPP